jgi:phosphoserine phosphatase
VFDLDGTLLRGPTVCEVLAAAVNRLPRMQEIERLTARSEIAAARIEMAGWYDGLSRSELRALSSRAQLAPGASEGVRTLRDAGVTVAIASITWCFAVEHFARLLGVEHTLATRLHESGEIEHVWGEHKAEWVVQLAGRLSVPRERTAGVGDSAGDHPMLDAVHTPFFVGPQLPRDRDRWLHWPGASIESIAAYLLKQWNAEARSIR